MQTANLCRLNAVYIPPFADGGTNDGDCDRCAGGARRPHLMDKARRILKPLAPPKDEQVTPAECGKDLSQMLKDALKG
jgi:hypothetical protein